MLRRDFLGETGWSPALEATFAGAINFTEYNWLLRAYMKYASKFNGGSTDTSRDHEYTDWQQVAAFASDVAELVAEAQPAAR
jgi:menaquinone-dependent protoporphyrinogen oxidase